MNYSLDRFSRLTPPAKTPFSIDFVVNLQARIDGSVQPQALPLVNLLFCDTCSKVVSREDVHENIDSYFCPQCLENMPSSEANANGMRCSKCWECPVCGSILTMQMHGLIDQVHYFACGYCEWNSNGKLEAPKPEELTEAGLSIERAGPGRQRLSELVDIFRARAQEQQRERELARRLRAQTSSSLVQSTLSANMLMARRFASGSMLLRPAQAAAFLSQQSSPSSAAGHNNSKRLTPRRSSSNSLLPKSVHWRVDDLEASLQGSSAKMLDLRASLKRKPETYALTPRKPEQFAMTPRAAAQESDSSPDSSPRKRGVFDASGEGSPSAAPVKNVPASAALAGLTVDELLGYHVLAGDPLIKKWRDGISGIEKEGIVATLHMQRLRQSAYGHRPPSSGASPIPSSKDGLAVGRLQLETTTWHAHHEDLLPVRKQLLTRRSYRCRLVAKGKGPGTCSGGERSPVPEPASPRGEKPCGRILVKPQINPCANPPFQKNSIAAAFVPQCRPWLVKCSGSDKATIVGDASTPEAASQRLSPGGSGELVFTLTNPLTSETTLRFTPAAFNPAWASAGKVDLTNSCDIPLEFLAKQNVEVLTKPFETKVGAFADVIEASEAGGESADGAKANQRQDDPDVIVGRRSNKLLVRLRFRAAPAATEGVPFPCSWLFFTKMVAVFTDHSNVEHHMPLVLRFALEEGGDGGAFCGSCVGVA